MFPIVLATDNNFCIHAAALISSIQKNSYDENLEIFVLADGLRRIYKNELQKCTELDLTIVDVNKWHFVRKLIPHKVTYLPQTAYFRLLIQELFKEYDRVLYLDVDTLVFANIARLKDVGFDGKLCLAVEDYSRDKKKKRVFSKFMKSREMGYFNSGVMVIDVKGWRRENIAQQAIHMLEHEMKNPKYADQEVLNVILENRWKPLERKWNCPSYSADYENMPNILHYIGNNKPFYNDYANGHKDTFYYYLKGTIWENAAYNFFKKIRIRGPFRLKSFLARILLGFTGD